MIGMWLLSLIMSVQLQGTNELGRKTIIGHHNPNISRMLTDIVTVTITYHLTLNISETIPDKECLLVA